MDPIVTGSLIESATTLFQVYLRLMEQAGLTEEQRLELETRERAKFLENRPDNLPKP
jgi:hypothetical protein